MQSTQNLIQKYNRPGPRYTSFPPVPFWQGAPSQAHWFEHLQAAYDPALGLDLYVHIPYCESLCYYCGCHRTITKNHGVEEELVNLILKEMSLYQEALGGLEINSLHLGGGTPTFLSPAHLHQLISGLTNHRKNHFIGSIEIDPRTCRPGHLEVIEELQMRRASLGIQDFAPEVQSAINRLQSPKMVADLVERLRRAGVESINFDLIYGLPMQTLASVSATINTVSQMEPDLISFYGYAHLPDRIKNQRLIKPEQLPDPELKRELYETGKRLLEENNYREVGLDHFGRPGSYLVEAQSANQLHRNFMGYVDRKSPILLGLGPSSISDSSRSFVQNQKDFKDYAGAILEGKLAIERGHMHSPEDLIVQTIILELMCQGKVSLPPEIPRRPEVVAELLSMQADGLVEMTPEDLKVTPRGWPFLRNVAMCFDFHLRRGQDVKFSQTI
jgi:oxygen-independent coproporphyrinogen III oxidase